MSYNSLTYLKGQCHISCICIALWLIPKMFLISTLSTNNAFLLTNLLES
jgi:hypothetical protein